MKKTIGILGSLLIAFAATSAAGRQPATAMSAKLAYQEGLFFQRTVGHLEKALKSYDRALEAATDAEDSRLLESILLRRAECYKLLGRENQQQTIIAALQKEKKATAARLGAARFFPPESDMIVQVDLAALLASLSLLDKLNLKAEIGSEEIEKTFELLGFDLLKDLHKVTVGITLSDSETMPAERWLIHAEGRFSGFRPDRLIEVGKKLAPGVLPRTKKIHGVNVLVFKVPLPQEKVKVMTVGVAFLDDSEILAGDLKVLKSALATRAGKAPGLSANPRLARLIGQVPENSTFWLAGVPTQIINKIQKMEHMHFPGLPKNLPEVAGLMLSGHITETEGFEAVALAFTEDLQSARLLGDICKGALALAQLVPVDEPLVQKLLDSLRVETQEREVKVSITLPGNLIASPKEVKVFITPPGSLIASPKVSITSPGNLKDAPRKAKGHGSLSINAIPWSVVFIDGKKAGNTPLMRIQLKAGRHDVTLVNEELGIREKLKIVIKAGKETVVSKQLKKK
jgi:hypothetical protein